MALNNTNIPSAASDVVAILDSNLNQLFSSARPIKAYISEPSRPMEHPLENGSIITDNIIFLPREIELSLILPSPDYRSVYSNIVQTYRAATLLTVQTKTSTYKNMIIVSPPHEENADQYDAIPMILKLKEVQFAVSATITKTGSGSVSLPASSVKVKSDQSTSILGEKQTDVKYYFFRDTPLNPGSMKVGQEPLMVQIADTPTSKKPVPLQPLTQSQLQTIRAASQ